jgi:hypothetical protein
MRYSQLECDAVASLPADSEQILCSNAIRISFVRYVFYVQHNSNYPDAGYPDRLGPLGNFVENSTKLF